MLVRYLCTYQYFPLEVAAEIQVDSDSEKNPNPRELDRTSRHAGGKLDTFSRISKLNYINTFDGPPDGFWAPHICQWVGNFSKL